MGISTTAPLADLHSGAAPLGGGLRRHRWQALGTNCELQFACDDQRQAEAFQAAAVSWVAQFEAKYSRFRPDSVISQINAAAGRSWVRIDPETEQMLDICGSLYQMTQGILDATALPVMKLWNYRAENPRIPSDSEIVAARELVGWTKVQRRPGQVYLPREGMALDLGGWGKEYAVDAVAEVARAHRIASVLVDFGHDLRAIGTPPGKPGWHIGLEDPRKPGTYRGSIAVRERGIASSGDYLRSFILNGRRYGHIIDPRVGRPVSNGSLQVTVIAPSCLQAGVLSTSAFILGAAQGIALIQQTPGVEALILTETARHQTRSFFQYVVET